MYLYETQSKANKQRKLEALNFFANPLTGASCPFVQPCRPHGVTMSPHEIANDFTC